VRPDKVLAHAPAIPLALGLAPAQRSEARPGPSAAIAEPLSARPSRTAEEELAILRDFPDPKGVEPPAPPPAPAPGRGGPARQGKAVRRPAYGPGEGRCTATAGRVELAAERDFAALPPDGLEAATLAFLRALE
jgi:ParB family chromosome partitioning protein